MNTVQVDTDDTIITITLNDPGTLNAMGAEMAREFREAVRLAADPAQGFRCLVITGAGRAFCSGGSLGMMTGSKPQTGDSEKISLGTHHHYVIKQLQSLPYPVVTAVNGPAAGLGFSYALAGDMVVAAESAFFVAAFRNIGVSPDGGLSWLLPKLVGWARAKELMLMGNRLPAQQALEWGLINRVYADERFMADTMQLARQLASGPTVALAEMRRLAWDSWELSFEQQLDQEERVQLQTFATADAREGALASLEKRQANFSGK